jgi:hypothetical protein
MSFPKSTTEPSLDAWTRICGRSRWTDDYDERIRRCRNGCLVGYRTGYILLDTRAYILMFLDGNPVCLTGQIGSGRHGETWGM